MAEPSHGAEFEKAYAECSACGTRRPLSKLVDGKCDNWVWLTPSETSLDLVKVDRCAELAKAREAKP